MAEEEFKTPEKIIDYLDKLDKEERIRKKKYQDYIKTKRKLPVIEKAEAWLQYTLKNIDFWGDYESYVYFLSRERGIIEEDINELIKHWKSSEQNSFYQCATGKVKMNPGFNEDQKVEEDEIDYSKAKQILKNNSSILPNFWFGTRYQDFSLDATMLRTYEWTKIGGFDDWFIRLAEDDKDLIFHGGFGNVPGCYWLFNMCRSNYAINLNRKSLETALEALKIPEIMGRQPWYIYQERGNIPNRKLLQLAYPIIAASIIFCSYRLFSDNQISNKDLIDEANNFILSNQDKDGGWKIFEDDKNFSIEATAFCIHALAMSRPTGWKYAVSKGKEWLESRQEQDGYWLDKSVTDPVYLTVLVLDSFELSIGGNKTTFEINNKEIDSQTSRKRFKIALSFPGEIRNRVEKIAKIIASKIGKENIFYDFFYKAQLARPDLDIFLQNIYRNESELIVIFIGNKYEEKKWCRLEWRAIRDLISERTNDIMPIKYEETDLPGFFSIDGYINLKEHNDNEIAEFIIERNNNKW